MVGMDRAVARTLQAMEAGETDVKSLEGFSAVCVSARNVRGLYVTYLEAERAPSSPAIISQTSSAGASDAVPTSTPPERQPPDAGPSLL